MVLDKSIAKYSVVFCKGIGKSPKAKKVLDEIGRGKYLYSIKNVEILVNNEEAMMEYLYTYCVDLDMKSYKNEC
jgi:hypothetical protein